MALLCSIVVVIAWRAGGPERRLALLLTGALALVGAIVLPYYLGLKAGRSGPALELVPLRGLVRDTVVIAVTFLPMSLLLVWARRPVRERMRAQGRVARLLVISALMNLLLFAILLAPLWSQHNFLLLAVFATGIVGGIALRALRERAWPAAFAVFTVFLLPFGLDCVHKARDWNDAPRVFHESGSALEHNDPAQRELYAWMRRETDLRAVFVDTDLGLPVYGQRALYVALPKREKFNEITTKGGDGYSFDPRIFMKIVDGYPADLVDRRLQIAARLLSGAEPTATDIADVAASGPAAYLVLRTGSGDPARARPGSLPVAFENPAATVLRLPRSVAR
jgi:hypothetical protein